MNEKETIKKIQELVPEILELKFGCKIETKDFTGIFVQYTSAGNYYIRISSGVFATIKEKDIIKNLGRPITLENVLIAISKKQGEWHTTFWGNGVIKIDENIEWIPNKPFQEQSKKTKEYIGDLLLNN